MNKKLIPALIALTTLLGSAQFFSGCSSKGINESNPKEMYEDADSDIKNDRYLLALDKLRIVKSKFSYSSYGALAQLRIGDVYFLQESYPESASAYETFVELYPKHEKAAYALFRSGEAYFKDIPSTIARDLKSAESAVQAFTSYLKKYPGGEFAAQANEMKSKSFNKLAEKEFDIAKFYIRRKKNDAAKVRLQKILDQYSGSEISVQAKDLLEHLPTE
jgi:outer membrane protein assembly factor BamD